MQNKNEDLHDKFPKVLWCKLGTVILVAVILFSDLHYQSKLEHKHDNVKPIPRLSENIDSLIWDVDDPVLCARKARYDALVKDYKYAFSEMKEAMPTWLCCEPFMELKSFTKRYVYPEFAEQIGAKNLRQYSKRIDNYMNDSVKPVYADVYRKKVIPKIRNDIRSK